MVSWAQFFAEYGLFLLKTLTILIAIAIVISLIANAKHDKKNEHGKLNVDYLNDKYRQLEEQLNLSLMSSAEFDKWQKQQQKEEKQKEKAAKKGQETEKSRVFVLEYSGDMHASGVDILADKITAILLKAQPERDEVVLKLESPGGVVHGYGLAASQLKRITSKNIPLTICIDKVAASGGYMMACTATKIIAAPFAVLGSIGVVAQLPNIYRLLKKHDIDVETLTAGEYKRTLTVIGENTEKGRQKMQEDIDETHQLFKDFVKINRPQLDIERLATGEIWYGQQAQALQLIDDIATSDEYLFDAVKRAEVYFIDWKVKQTLAEKLGLHVQMGVKKALEQVSERLFQQKPLP